MIATEQGLQVDEAGFETEMKQQKDRSRAATTVDAEDWVILKEGANQFVGYDQLETTAQVLKYRRVKAKGKDGYQVVLDQTSFYAESGGQVGDRGWLDFGNTTVEVIDTKKDNDLIIHFTATLPATVEGEVKTRVNAVLRKKTTLHHSATHLLHAALRKVLGTHVAQKGSLNNEENLRFDFSHFAKMTADEIAQVESIVNEKIRENVPVVIQTLPKEEALKLGAMALFGEKYGDVVRVVIMDPNYSVELCGGTHVGSTGELGFFKITSESAIAAGVRRLEAICGEQAEQYVNEQSQLLQSLREALKNPKDLLRAVEQLQQDYADLKKQAEVLEARQLATLRDELLTKEELVNGIHFIGTLVEVGSADALKKLCHDLKLPARDHVAVLAAVLGGKPYVAVGIADNLVATKGLDAGKIIKEQVAPLIKGGGGGQKTLATAGGQDAQQLTAVINTITSLL